MSVYVVACGEDRVHAAIIKRLFRVFGDKYCFLSEITITGGKPKLIKNINKYCNGARRRPYIFFMLMDMDSLAHPEIPGSCPQMIIDKYLDPDRKKPVNFMLRLAVAEGENWLLADYDNLCDFLLVNRRASIVPDEISAGKEAIINLAHLSGEREYKENIGRKGTSRTGPMYNDIIIEFINDRWQPRYAAQYSKSLRRTLNRLEHYQPW